jgi:hypothetical protein
MNMRNRFFFFVLLIIIGIPVLGMISNAGHEVKPTPMMTNSLAVAPRKPVDTVGSVGSTPVARDVSREYADEVGGMVQEKSTTLIAPIPPDTLPVPGNSGFAAGQDRTIVKTAQLGMIVENPRQVTDKITQITQDVKGVVTNSNIYDNDTYQSGGRAEIIVRVPVDQLNTALEKFRALAIKVTQDSVSADDQTKQKVDMEARLKNLKASEEQLLTIMKQAKNVNETLEVQRQLTEIRGQIESMTASLENLQGDAAMSTVSIHLSTKPSDLPITGPSQLSIIEELKTAVRDTARAYRNLFVAGLRVAILILPALVIFAIVWFIWQRRARKS